MEYKAVKEWTRRMGESVMARKAITKVQKRDAWVVSAFVGAISVLILACCYVVSRLSIERAYRAKWSDYNDCGWA